MVSYGSCVDMCGVVGVVVLIGISGITSVGVGIDCNVDRGGVCGVAGVGDVVVTVIVGVRGGGGCVGVLCLCLCVECRYYWYACWLR